jgi:hypothetical protein
MDRFSIMRGLEPPPKEKPVRKSSPITLSMKKYPPSKKLISICKLESDNMSLAVEISPRDSTCSRCHEKIPKHTRRYKANERSGYFFIRKLYHTACLPNKFIRFRRRDIVKETIEKMINYVNSYIENFDDESIQNRVRMEVVRGIR